MLAKDPPTLKLEPHNNPNKLNLKVQELGSVWLGWKSERIENGERMENWEDE